MGIQGKLIATMSIATAIILGIATWIYYQRAFSELDLNLGNRLTTISETIAREITPEKLTQFEPGEEHQKSYTSFQNRLLKYAITFELKNIYIMNSRGEVVMDAQGEASFGLPIAESILPPKIMESLQNGKPQTTPVYEEGLGRLFKSAYLPLYPSTKTTRKPIAYLRVDASPEFLAALNSIRNGIFAAAATTIPIAMLIAAFLAYTLLTPIRRLTLAARRLAQGERDVVIGLSGHDELGLLSKTFDQMSTALRQKEEHLQALRKEADERAEYMREMAGVVAHEVRNPLAATQGYLELLLRNTPVDSPAGKYGQASLTELGRLRTLVDTFLRFARTPEIVRYPTHPRHLLQEIVSIISPRAMEKQIEVQTDVLESLAEVAIDEHQLRDALVNIALNAIDTTPQGSSIQIRIQKEGGNLQISVSDKGTGIPLQNRQKIFSPFFTTKASGTGLGLPTARRIVEAHGGTISVQSDVGHGTTFMIRIPA